MAGKRRKGTAAALPVAIVALAGIAFGITLIVKGNTTSVSPDQTALLAEQTAATTTEVTTTTTEETTTTTTTAPLPPGSVTGISLTFYSTALQVGDAPVMPWVTMTPEDATDKSELWESSDEKVATVDQYGHITPIGNGTCTVRVSSVNNPAVFAEVAVTVGDVTTTAAATTTTTAVTGADGAARTDIEVINGVTYVQGVLIANKTYGLPSDYNPGLDPQAEAAFNEMAAAASQDGLSLSICSGFRSFNTQSQLYNNYCNRDGQEAADRYSARPGHSEHQTGLAMDINMASDAFNDTPEAKWLADNCWKYGFIIRYPQGKEDITGYKYESWHCRYLGKDWAKKIFDSGKTLEEYFNIDSKYAT